MFGKNNTRQTKHKTRKVKTDESRQMKKSQTSQVNTKQDKINDCLLFYFL